MDASNLYATLGLGRNATQAEIKKQYYKLAREHHPDKQKDSNGDAGERFKHISYAYDILINDESRKEYDESGADIDATEEIFGELPESGIRQSDIYKKMVIGWTREYNPHIIVNNVGVVIEIVSASLSEAKSPIHRVPSVPQANHYELFIGNKGVNSKNIIPIINDFTDHDMEPIVSTDIEHDDTMDSIIRKKWIETFVPIPEIPQIISTDSLSKAMSEIASLHDSIIQNDPISDVKITSDKGICTITFSSAKGKSYSYTEPTFTPSPKSTIKTDNCKVCKKEFGIFRWRYNCYTCGNFICSDCLNNDTNSMYGVYEKVDVCDLCNFTSRLWMLRKFVKNNTDNFSSCDNVDILLQCVSYLSVSRSDTILTEGFKKLVQKVIEANIPELIIRYANTTDNKLVELIRQLIDEGKYKHAWHYSNLIGPAGWNKYAKEANLFGLICLKRLYLGTDFLSVVMRLLVNNVKNNDVFKFYGLFLKKAYVNVRDYLHRMKDYELSDIMIIIKFLDSNFRIEWGYNSRFSDTVNYCSMMMNRVTTIEKWFKTLQLKPININLILPFIFTQQKEYYDNIEPIEKKYIKEKNYMFAILCYKLRNTMSKDMKSIQSYLIEQIKLGEYEYAEYITTLCLTFDELSDICWDRKEYVMALRAYLRLGNYDTILQKARQLSQEGNHDICYLYHLTVLRHNASLSLPIINYYVKNSTKTLGEKIEMLKSGVLRFKNPFGNWTLQTHLMILDLMEISHSAMYDAVKRINSFVMKPQQADNIKKKYIAYCHMRYAKVKSALYEQNGIAIVDAMKDFTENDHDVITQLIADVSGKGGIKSVTPSFRALLYLVRSIDNRNIKQIGKSVHDLRYALLEHPSDDMVEAVIHLLEDKSFRQDIINYQDTSNIFMDLSAGPIQFGNKLKPTRFLRLLEKYDTELLDKKPLDAAYTYADLTAAVGDPIAIISCCFMACVNLIRHINTGSITDAEKYAYWKLIKSICRDIYFLSMKFVTPSMQIYVYRIILTIYRDAGISCHSIGCRRGGSQKMIDDIDEIFIKEITNGVTRMVRVIPLVSFPLYGSYDTLYSEIMTRKLTLQFLMKMEEKNDALLPSHIINYYLFEGTWKGWAPELDFAERRTKAMVSLLKSKGWKMEFVQDVLNWPMIKREDGWMSDKVEPLIIPGKGFARMEGFEINTKTGKIKLLLREPATDGGGIFGIGAKPIEKDKLFNMDDVLDIMQSGTGGAIFTLDQPDTEKLDHPFQEMKYAPKGIGMTNYLGTLLHTDYLLKMFTAEIEINSNPPFESRPINEGVLKRLPKDLQDAIKLKRHNPSGRPHRFWIQAGDVIFYEEHKDNVIRITFDEVPMSVQKHMMKYNADGLLVDDEEDKDDTPEGEFARKFTENYVEIGEYFPEFLRLRELVKLGTANRMIGNIVRGIRDKKDNISHFLPKIREVLNKMRSQFTYPLNTSDRRESEFQRILRDNGVQEYQVSYSEISKVRSSISNQLASADESIIAQVTEAINKSFETSIDSSWTRYWLDSRKLDEFVDHIGKDVKRVNNIYYERLKGTIDAWGINIEEQDLKMENNGECVWVPAAFNSMPASTTSSAIKVYGGVNLMANARSGGTGTGGSGGSTGGTGGMGGSGAPPPPPPARPRYVESMDASGKITGTCYGVSNTGTEHKIFEIRHNLNPTANTRTYYRPYGEGNTHHVTVHNATGRGSGGHFVKPRDGGRSTKY